MHSVVYDEVMNVVRNYTFRIAHRREHRVLHGDSYDAEYLDVRWPGNASISMEKELLRSRTYHYAVQSLLILSRCLRVLPY